MKPKEAHLSATFREVRELLLPIQQPTEHHHLGGPGRRRGHLRAEREAERCGLFVSGRREGEKAATLVWQLA
jgi:hypothetical protein